MILIDTNVLVALTDARDGLNQRARSDLEALNAFDFLVITPVLAEACFLLEHPVQRKRLIAVIRALEISLWPDRDGTDLIESIFDWLAKLGDQAPDWADAQLAVLCSQRRNVKVWTYDTEFQTHWRQPDGAPIPLAVTKR